MSFRLTHIRDYHRFIAIDLGLYRVRAGIYDISDSTLQCTGFSSVRQSRKNFYQGSIADISGIIQNTEQAILQAGESGGPIPNDIIMSFPSHSFVSDSITTQYLRADTESTLTMNEIDGMIKRTESESFDRARIKSRKQYGILNDDLRLVSSTIIDITIDGRPIANPIGFSGGRIRLTVLNIFVPSSEFNIIRSIVSGLGKKVISLIPEPLILPKLIESSQYISDSICIIDIGYRHTTVTIMESNRIIGFEVFNCGTGMLMELIALNGKNLSFLQIENTLCSTELFENEVYRESLEEFFLYVQDATFGYLKTEHINIQFDNLFLHGNIFENTAIMDVFGKIMEDRLGYDLNKKRIHEMGDKKLNHDNCMTHGLAQMATELLLVKKDPLVRILRYILYQYE